MRLSQAVWRRSGLPRWRAHAQSLLLAVLCVALATGGCSANRNSGRIVTGADWVLPPEEVHFGASYAEWSARWWQWVYEQPRANHPLYDATGADAWEGQLDPVWFLCGGVDAGGRVERYVNVPRGRALFFPIVARSSDTTNCQGPDLPYSFTEMRDMLAEGMRDYRDLRCEIDGATVLESPDFDRAARHRAQAPEFEAFLPADNILNDVCGGLPPPARVVSPIASDGVWMMIGPMPPGAHLLHFSGRIDVPDGVGPDLRFDVTYHLNVLP